MDKFWHVYQKSYDTIFAVKWSSNGGLEAVNSNWLAQSKNLIKIRRVDNFILPYRVFRSTERTLLWTSVTRVWTIQCLRWCTSLIWTQKKTWTEFWNKPSFSYSTSKLSNTAQRWCELRREMVRKVVWWRHLHLLFLSVIKVPNVVLGEP